MLLFFEGCFLFVLFFFVCIESFKSMMTKKKNKVNGSFPLHEQSEMEEMDQRKYGIFRSNNWCVAYAENIQLYECGFFILFMGISFLLLFWVQVYYSKCELGWVSFVTFIYSKKNEIGYVICSLSTVWNRERKNNQKKLHVTASIIAIIDSNVRE